MLKGLTSGFGKLFKFPVLNGGVFSTAFSLSKLAAVVFAALLFFAPDKLSVLGPNWQGYGTAAISAALIAALFALIRALSSGVSLIFWFVIVAALAFKIAPSSSSLASISQKLPGFFQSKAAAIDPMTVTTQQKPSEPQRKGPLTKEIGDVGEAFWFKEPMKLQPTTAPTIAPVKENSISKILNLENLNLNLKGLGIKKSGGDSALSDYDDSIYYGKKKEE